MTTIYLMLALALIYYLLQNWETQTRCSYCGETGKQHGQNCPMDYLNREERE